MLSFYCHLAFIKSPSFCFKYFYMETTKVKLNALVIALLPLLGSPVIHAETTAAPVLENRAAQGDITTPGGARRLSGDQTAALQASLINKPAKNIILLIGDGMGDSEITAARNYAEGAGGFFKGIDARR